MQNLINSSCQIPITRQNVMAAGAGLCISLWITWFVLLNTKQAMVL